MKKPIVNSIKSTLETVKESWANPLRDRVRKHIFDKNDVITDDDIRNISLKIFSPQNANNKLAQG